MMRIAGRCLSGLLMLIAAVWAIQRAQGPEFIGIDFVQFYVTGRHVVSGGDTRIYADEVRREILETAWQEARAEGTDSRLYRALDFRHQRSWESYSSPFLYAVFGVLAGGKKNELKAPSSGLSATFSPESGEKGRAARGEEYESVIRGYWMLCLGSTVAGFIGFGWALRIPGWSMLVGAAVLVWFSPLRIDLNVANVNQIQFGMLGVLAVILGCRGNAESRRRSGGATVSGGATEEEPSGVASGHIEGTRSNQDLRWLAIGCQIHLLTSHLVWYHYFVLSLPAILVILRSIVASTSAISLRVMLSLILLWCLVLLGLEPLDGLLNSPPEEHPLRCLFANAFLLVMLVSIED